MRTGKLRTIHITKLTKKPQPDQGKRISVDDVEPKLFIADDVAIIEWLYAKPGAKILHHQARVWLGELLEAREKNGT